MRRMRGVPDEDDVLMVPSFVDDGRKRPPQRAIDEQPVATNVIGEERLAVAHRVLLGRSIEPGAPPCVLVALDDERRSPLLEWIRVHLEQPVLALLED